MSFYAKHKQLVDQAAHFGVGFGWVAAFAALDRTGLGLFTLGLCAVLREMWQHDWEVVNMGWGSYLDLSFFAIGGALAAFLL